MSFTPDYENIPAEELAGFLKQLMEIPAVKLMFELDTWGKGKGLPSDKRAEIVKKISEFMTATDDTEAAKEYIKRAVDIVAELGPGVLGSLSGK